MIKTNSRYALFFLFYLCITVISCRSAGQAEKKILMQKGWGEEMVNRLKPLIAESRKPFNGLVGISKENCLATVNENGVFAYVKITEAGQPDIIPITPNYPIILAGDLHSDTRYNILWMQRGRGFYFFDIETEKRGHCVASADGNDRIMNCFLADPVNKLFIIEVDQIFPVKGFFYVLYSLEEDRILFKSPVYHGTVNPFSSTEVLFCEFAGKLVKWFAMDFYMKEKKETKLTKQLTKMQMSISYETRAVSMEKRLILGTGGIEVDNKFYTYSVRWDESMEKIKMEPLLLQLKGINRVSNLFEISPDNNWVKSLKYPDPAAPVKFPPELIIFQCSTIYPQCLSLPIYCGYTKKFNPGAFMNHKQLGPCYVEWDPEFPKKLFIYQLNEGLKLLDFMDQ